jgi:putative hydrolase of the HAD superfamily
LTRIPSQGLVLDLDDTLYLERDYVRSGFEAVGRHLAERRGVQDFGDRCWALFQKGVRATTFDDVLNEIGMTGSVQPAELVEVYRCHAPRIELREDARAFLDAWPRERPLALITDGPVASQSAKIDALQLRGRLNPIVMSDEFGVGFRKPHDRPFEEVERLLGLPATELTYIADNPRKDFIAPRRRGWHTIRIRRPYGEHSGRDDSRDVAAHSEITDFSELSW